MFLAPGICPARCAVSVIPGGAMISPTNSGVDRTSTSAVFLALSAFSTSGRLARIAAFTFLGTGYVVARTFERSVTNGRPSATHFARPPFINFEVVCPYSWSSQKANAANQLLLSPYSTTVVLGVTPASDKSFANAFLSGMSRRTGSFSCDCQFQPTAPAMCPESYAVVSTSTSIKRMLGSVRCPATHSVETSTSGCVYATLTSNQVKPDSASRVSVQKKTIGMAGLVPGQSPGDVVQLGLIVREVREGNAGQQIVDPLLQHSPDGPDAARSLRTTSLGIDGMEVAIDFEGDVLRGFDHVLDGDDVGLTGEMITALCATDRIHQAGTPQPQEDLLDVIVGQALLLGELACRDRPLPRTPREVHGDDQPVLGPGGDAHGCNIGPQPRLAQPLRRRQGRQRAAEALCAAICRLLPPVAAEFWTHARPHLHPEHVFPGVTLQPQEARVEVPHGPAAVEVGTHAAMRPLRHAAVEPFRVEPRQEETAHAVHPAPRPPARRCVAGRAAERVAPTSGRAP